MTSTMEDARGAGERQVDEEEEFDADYDFVVKSIGLKNPDGSELFDISKPHILHLIRAQI